MAKEAQETELLSFPDELDQTDVAIEEDQGIDTLEDAVNLLEDDSPDASEEQPDTDEPAEDTPEDEESETDKEGDEESDDDGADETLVKLKTGETVSLDELEGGYMRTQDYTEKTTALAESRTKLEGLEKTYTERGQFVENVLQNLQNYMEKLVPSVPSIELARSDPGEFQAQQALRQRAIDELTTVFQAKETVQQKGQSNSDEDSVKLKESEDAALVKLMPYLSKPEKRASFDVRNSETAKELGFTDDEIKASVDHRMLRMVHFARKGMRAEAESMKTARNAKRRLTERPKQGKASTARKAPNAARQAKGMQRLAKTGSIDDAMLLDIE